MKSIIVIILQDQEYSEALGKYLSNNAPELDIAIYDNSNEENRGKIEGDILLTDHTGSNLIDIVAHFKWRVVLTEDFEEVETELQEDLPKMVYKYSPASTILRDIRFIASVIIGGKRVVRKNSGTTLIGFGGGGSGTGKTVLCISVARDISKRYGKRVLYLNYECIPSTKAYFSEASSYGRPLSHYLYYLFKSSSNISVAPEGFLFCDSYNVSGFFPDVGINELRTLNVEELQYLLKCLCESNAFDYIFVDLSSEWSDESQFIIEQCEKYYLICDTSVINIMKNENYKSILETKTTDGTKRRFETIVNKMHYFDEYTGNLQIESDPDSFYEGKGTIQISLGGSFGIGIRTIGDCLVSAVNSNEKENRTNSKNSKNSEMVNREKPLNSVLVRGKNDERQKYA